MVFIWRCIIYNKAIYIIKFQQLIYSFNKIVHVKILGLHVVIMIRHITELNSTYVQSKSKFIQNMIK